MQHYQDRKTTPEQEEDALPGQVDDTPPRQEQVTLPGQERETPPGQQHDTLPGQKVTRRQDTPTRQKGSSWGLAATTATRDRTGATHTKKERACLNVTETRRRLKQTTGYEAAQETYQVQKCTTIKDRVCNTPYAIDVTTKDNYQYHEIKPQ
jgi:hypothetical protein